MTNPDKERKPTLVRQLEALRKVRQTVDALLRAGQGKEVVPVEVRVSVKHLGASADRKIVALLAEASFAPELRRRLFAKVSRHRSLRREAEQSEALVRPQTLEDFKKLVAPWEGILRILSSAVKLAANDPTGGGRS